MRMEYCKPFKRALEELSPLERDTLEISLVNFQEFNIIFKDMLETRLMASKSMIEKLREYEKNLPIDEKIKRNEDSIMFEKKRFYKFKDFYRLLANSFGLERANEILIASLERDIPNGPYQEVSQMEAREWKHYLDLIISKKEI